MKISTLKFGLLALSFVMPAAVGSSLEPSQNGAGGIVASLPSPIGRQPEPLSRADVLLLASATPRDRFQDECGECHGDADEFVRESLTVKNGVLTGLGSEMPLADFMKTHRKLKQAEAAFYTDMLTRVAGEIGLK